MNQPVARREVLAAGLALAASPSFAQTGRPRVAVLTDKGAVVLELETAKAPITSANFLHYVDVRRFDGASFYRASRDKSDASVGLIEGGLQNDPARLFAPIAHESTTQTGLRHVDGTISMARYAPGTATADFFICVGPAHYLDAVPGGDPGFAAFGLVIEGMEVVKAILALPTDGFARNPVMKGQILSPPVAIVTMRRA